MIATSIRRIASRFGPLRPGLLAVVALSTLLLIQRAECGLGYVAHLKNVKPVVEVSAKRGQPFESWLRHKTLAEGSTIRTRKAGKATIIFTNQTRVGLYGRRAQLEILSEPTERSPLIIRILKAGKYWIYPKGGTQVQTVAAIAASLHTEYLLEVPEEKSSRDDENSEEDGRTAILTVIDGTVTWSNPQGRVVVNAGEQSVVRVGQAPSPPVAVDVSGIMQWTADITGLPIEFETPFSAADAKTLQNQRSERALAARNNPDNGEAHQRFGEVLHDLGEYSAAVEQFEEAVRLNSQNAGAYFGLGQAKRGQGDIPGALAAYQEAHRLAQGDPQPLIGEALAYLSEHNQERQDAAGQELARQERGKARAVLSPLPNSAAARAVMGLVELREGNNSQAIEQLEAATRLEPRLYQAHVLLALAYLAQNQTSQSLQAARRGVALEPQSAQAQGTLAMVLFFGGETKPAAEAAKRAVALNPFSPFALLTQGRVLLSRLRTDDARQSYQQAAALAPNLWIAQVELGAVFLRLDRLLQAETAYERALELSPNSAEAHAGLAMVLQRWGDAKKAEAEFLIAVRLAQENVSVRAALANFYIEQGELEKALQLLKEDNQDDPEFGISYVRLSEVSLYRQKLFDAQEYARRAVKLLPDSAIARYQLGRVYLEQGRTVQAEQQLRQAVTLDPQFAAARYGLGFTRELAESGLFSNSFLSGSFTLGSSGSALTLQNLQTPGAEERIQAALQDPTVVRTASRSYGDTQLGAVVGGQDTRNLEFSHLETTGNHRGVRGMIAERQETDGVRENADTTFDRLGIVFGQKARTNPSGFFIQGQIERRERGLDSGSISDEDSRQSRSAYKVPRLLTGFNLQSNERSHTRVLVQVSKPWLGQVASSIFGNFDTETEFRSLNAELRHDRQIGQKHLLSAGLFAGTRKHEDDARFTISPPDPPLLLEHTLIKSEIRASGAYLRDEVKINQRLSVTGEMQLQKLMFSASSQDLLSPLKPILVASDENTMELLPKIIIAYRPNARSGLRLRVRRLLATPRDFQLLSPTDVFFELEDLPEPFLGLRGDEFGRGSSSELEYDHTFRNTSFLRVGLFHQQLGPAEIFGVSGIHPKVRQYGVRVSYEGTLSRDTTFFMNLHFNKAKDVASRRDVAQVPRFAAEVGVQYLNHKGYFVQPLFFYSGSYLQSLANPVQQNSFGVFNVRVGKRWGLRSVLFLELNNISDEKYIIGGNLQPGRQIRIGAVQRF
jgi:tetratricopeptide (TPR) repeat protein